MEKHFNKTNTVVGYNIYVYVQLHFLFFFLITFLTQNMVLISLGLPNQVKMLHVESTTWYNSTFINIRDLFVNIYFFYAKDSFAMALKDTGNTMLIPQISFIFWHIHRWCDQYHILHYVNQANMNVETYKYTSDTILSHSTNIFQKFFRIYLRPTWLWLQKLLLQNNVWQ